jgi:hypothetical protein
MLKLNLLAYTIQPIPILGRVDLAAVFLVRDKFASENVLFGTFCLVLLCFIDNRIFSIFIGFVVCFLLYCEFILYIPKLNRVCFSLLVHR